MSYSNPFRVALLGLAATFAFACAAGESPQHERHELMESVGKAAKPIGKMLKGENDFDAAVVMTSLNTFQDVASKFGGLFPPGSETGEDTEAAPAIWEDRAGFDQALANWTDAVAAAIDANPQSLEAMKPVVGPVFKSCKGCHDTYRIED
jgi:cytochrome c556